METQLLLILTAYAVNSGLTSAQTPNDVDNRAFTSKIKAESETKENFKHLLNSIVNNNATGREILREVLKQDVAIERRSFDTMKEELSMARNRNAYKKINFYRKSNIGENILLRKREDSTSENHGESHNNHEDFGFDHYADHDPKNESVEWDDNFPSYSTPAILNESYFMDHLENVKPNIFYERVLSEYNKTVVELGNKAQEQRKRYKNLQNEMKRKIFPLRMCCEPQFLRYYINHAKELCGVRRSNVLFFLDGHRREWIEKINANRGQHTLAGRLEQGIRRNNMSIEVFVNQTEIIDMRASVAIHSYLSRAVRPMTPREKFAINRFIMSLEHGKMFNILAAAMMTPNITMTIDGIVKVDSCNEILDLESDEMKIIIKDLY